MFASRGSDTKMPCRRPVARVDVLRTIVGFLFRSVERLAGAKRKVLVKGAR